MRKTHSLYLDIFRVMKNTRAMETDQHPEVHDAAMGDVALDRAGSAECDGIAALAPDAGVDLDRYRDETGMTWQQLADRVGAKSPGQAQNWATGAVRPSLGRLMDIHRATGGRVTVFAMYQRRLEWERANRRPVTDIDGGADVECA